jgi:alkanesulfonate monooxygenase SsuD/methylene tetrahydromethanopterin reductase-like flavin-dependent oxidoreductase (luciferase family)
MHQRELRIGLRHTTEDCSIEDLRLLWRMADQGGLDHLWDSDHLASPGPAGPERPVLEAWTLLGAMAVATSRIRIGCMVTANTYYRHPALLAKMASTVDHLSNGRLEFGIGASWGRREHEMFGLEGLSHRVGRLAESLDIITSLWTATHTNFQGRYYTLKDAVAIPKPVQQPHPPIWIGAGGEQMMKVVARYADVWNASARARQDIERAAGFSSALDDSCTDIGRNPAEIRRSVDLVWDGRDASAFIESCSTWVAAGYSEIVVLIIGGDPPRIVDRVCDVVVPQLRKLIPS